jgi:hypothetical protein
MEIEEERQWNEVMKLAEKYGLIAYAYGGTAILFSHDVQREQGCYADIQYKCGLRPHL